MFFFLPINKRQDWKAKPVIYMQGSFFYEKAGFQQTEMAETVE